MTTYLYFESRGHMLRQAQQAIICALNNQLSAAEGDDLPAQYETLCWQFCTFCLERPELILAKTQFDHSLVRSVGNRRRGHISAFHALLEKGASPVY